MYALPAAGAKKNDFGGDFHIEITSIENNNNFN